jgi:hypothetical protein
LMLPLMMTMQYVTLTLMKMYWFISTQIPPYLK